ncbi:MAG TPA: HEAT repeat domain-containing protein [Vicinamibacterales bacterium]|nr:HEAT repeat domain-containing protein [Vicinamibacterales bacterium]
MTRLLALTIVGAVLTAAPAPLPQAGSGQPPFQNAKVEQRSATSIDRELASAGSSADPVWFGWRVPMIDGDRGCDTWINNDIYFRGFVMESRGETPPATQPSGPARLEGGTGLVVFVRMINGNVERLRGINDGCPVDGGGRTVYWLNGITPAESLRYLQTFTQMDALNIDARRNLASSALSAIALHRDPGADAILDKLADSTGDSSMRSSALRSLAAYRGQHGFDKVKAALATERESSRRVSLVTALGQTRQPATADTLLNLARTDADPKVRAEAAYYYAARAGVAGVGNLTSIIEQDQSDDVKRRAISGLNALPNNAGVEPLLKIARSSRNLALTKAAVSALSSSKDPRALAYMEELVKR